MSKIPYNLEKLEIVKDAIYRFLTETKKHAITEQMFKACFLTKGKRKGFLRDKHEVFEELTTPLISMLAHALQKARCKPISGVVKLVGKNHTVNLGSFDGITANSLFMLTDGSRGVFKPVKIFNEMSTVVALTSSPTGSLYQNKQVYLLK